MGNYVLYMYSGELWYMYKDYCVSWRCPLLGIPKGAERSRSWIYFWPHKTMMGLICSVVSVQNSSLQSLDSRDPKCNVLSWKHFVFDLHISFLPLPPSKKKDLWHIEFYMWRGELDKVMWEDTILYWNWCILIFHGNITLLSLFSIYLYI
jgi:hypothetical protein